MWGEPSFELRRVVEMVRKGVGGDEKMLLMCKCEPWLGGIVGILGRVCFCGDLNEKVVIVGEGLVEIFRVLFFGVLFGESSLWLFVYCSLRLLNWVAYKSDR